MLSVMRKANSVRATTRNGRTQPRHSLTNQQYIIAARVRGTVVDDNDLFVSDTKDKKETGAAAQEVDPAEAKEAVDPAEDPTKAGPKKNNIDVVLVSDIDWIAPIIFQLREIGENQDIQWKFQNVPFVLNILDSLAGDDRFVVDYLAEEVLDRQPAHVRRFLLDTSILGGLTAVAAAVRTAVKSHS